MNPRSTKNVLVGLLVAALVGAASYWFAVERPRRAEEFLAAKQARVDNWITDQKRLLTNDTQDHLYFYGTSNTDDIVARFSGMPEIENVGFSQCSGIAKSTRIDVVWRVPTRRRFGV